MFFGMQDFDFYPNLIKFYPNFIKVTQSLSNLSKFDQILPIFCPNLSKKLARGYGRIPSSYATKLKLDLRNFRVFSTNSR